MSKRQQKRDGLIDDEQENKRQKTAKNPRKLRKIFVYKLAYAAQTMPLRPKVTLWILRV